MQSGFETCLNFTLSPANDGQPFHVDTGGATSWGVTRAVWSRWIGRPASVDDMKAVTRSSVSGLYRAWYWNTIAGDKLPAGLDLMTFDMGVTAGEHSAAVQLQQVLGFTGDDVDGHIGPITLSRAASEVTADVIERLTHRQEFYYRSCSTFSTNGNGWLNRLQRRSTAALAMLSP